MYGDFQPFPIWRFGEPASNWKRQPFTWLGALGFPWCSRYFLWMFTPVSPKMGIGISHRCHRNPPWSSNIFGQLKRAIFGACELAQIGPPGWETQRFFFGTSSINFCEWCFVCLSCFADLPLFWCTTSTAFLGKKRRGFGIFATRRPLNLDFLSCKSKPCDVDFLWRRVDQLLESRMLVNPYVRCLWKSATR